MAENEGTFGSVEMWLNDAGHARRLLRAVHSNNPDGDLKEVVEGLGCASPERLEVYCTLILLSELSEEFCADANKILESHDEEVDPSDDETRDLLGVYLGRLDELADAQASAVASGLENATRG